MSLHIDGGTSPAAPEITRSIAEPRGRPSERPELIGGKPLPEAPTAPTPAPAPAPGPEVSQPDPGPAEPPTVPQSGDPFRDSFFGPLPGWIRDYSNQGDGRNAGPTPAPAPAPAPTPTPTPGGSSGGGDMPGIPSGTAYYDPGASGTGPNKLLIATGLLLALGGGYWWYRRRRRKNNAN